MERAGFDRLLAILEAQESLFLELRDGLQAERRAMEELDAESLEQAVRSKEAIAAEARVVETSRIEVTEALAREAGLDTERASLAELAEAAGDAAGPLREIRGRLRALVAALSELTEANALLAGRSLEEVRTTLEVFARLAPGDATYGPQGAGRDSRRSGRLLHRSA